MTGAHDRLLADLAAALGAGAGQGDGPPRGTGTGSEGRPLASPAGNGPRGRAHPSTDPAAPAVAGPATATGTGTGTGAALLLPGSDRRDHATTDAGRPDAAAADPTPGPRGAGDAMSPTAGGPDPARMPAAAGEPATRPGVIQIGDAARERPAGINPANADGPIAIAPRDTAQMAAALAVCARHGVSVVPQGGLTGLVGGAVQTGITVAVSTRLMNRIEAIDPVSGTATVGAGVTIAALQQAAADYGLHPGLDLPSRDSATVGGTISTNAGGIEAFRHGVMRRRVLGLEVVLPDGRVMSDLSRVTKVSAGYDIKQLFIGAEGTLGLVTRAVIRLDPLVGRGPVMLLGMRDDHALMALLRHATALGRHVAAEAMWARYFQTAAAAQGWRQPDYSGTAPVHLLLCLADTADAHDTALALWEHCASEELVREGVLASSGAEAAAIWALREQSDVIYHRYPGCPSYDVSVPISLIPEYVATIREGLGRIGIDPFIFGHLGDGNLHIAPDRAGAALDQADRARIEAVLYDPLPAMGGSFSAEHGVGLARVEVLARQADPVKLALMRAVKDALDPDGRMNPGKVLAAAGQGG